MNRGRSRITYAAAKAIKRAIDEDPLSRKSVNELFSQARAGRNNLLAAFKIITGGKTIRRYRLEKRMEEARKMLTQAKMTVKEVAMECGYKNQNNFSADYKDIFGLSPNNDLL